MMKSFLIVLTLLGMTILAVFGLGDVYAASSEVRVSSAYTSSTPGFGSTHFSTIQDGINGVSIGGTVHVEAGTYQEHLEIDKRLSIIGYNRPVIDGGGSGNLVDVKILDLPGTFTGYGVTLKGLQLQNAEFALWSVSPQNLYEDLIFSNNNWHIMLAHSSYNNIVTKNTLKDNGEGIMVSSSYNTISENTFRGAADTLGIGCTGIRLVGYDAYNLVVNNDLHNYRGHIVFLGTSHNVVAGNTINKSWSTPLLADKMRYAGMILWNSHDNTIVNNSISDIEGAGIRLFSGSSNNHLEANIIKNTDREGVGVYYESNNNIIQGHAIQNTQHEIVVKVSSGNSMLNNGLAAPTLVTVPKIAGKGSPPDYKDWIHITGNVLWEDKVLTLDAPVVINKGAVLTIRNSEIGVEENTFQVESGGSLIILDSVLTGKEGIMVSSGGKIHAENNEFNYMGSWDGGGAIQIYGDNAIIKENVFKGAYVALQIRESSGHQIIGNKIYNGSEGILIWDMKNHHNMLIKDNQISNMLAGGIIGHELSGSVITGNILSNIEGPAIALGTYARGWDYLNENKIYNNEFLQGAFPLSFTRNNIWYEGTLGNYYWDYQEKYPAAAESTNYPGIWNQAYSIGGNVNLTTLDIYPLMKSNQPSPWAITEIESAKELNLVTSKVLRGFQERITREEFCELAIKLYEAMSGEKAMPISPNPFKDTANPEILKANNLGIVKGVSEIQFAPYNYVTRQEISAMLYRTLRVAMPEVSLEVSGVTAFADEGLIASWAINEVRFANSHGIMMGVGGNRIDPLGNTTKEQAIALVTRMYHTFIKK